MRVPSGICKITLYRTAMYMAVYRDSGYFVHFNKLRDLAFEVIIKFSSLKAIRG